MTAATKAPAPASSLHTKLATLREGFGPIEKGGTNKGVGDGYKFVEATEVGRRFIAAAGAASLTMLPIQQHIVDIRETVSKKMVNWTIKTIWRITDADSGEFIDVESYGQGADSADKALPKAQTNAMKYAILLVLQKAGDDPEADGKTDQLESQESKAKAATAARKAAEQSDVTSVTAEAPVAPAEAAVVAAEANVAMASEGMRKKIRATAREKGFSDQQLKAFAIFTIGKDSSLKWTAADGDRLLAELDDVARVLSFQEANPA